MTTLDARQFYRAMRSAPPIVLPLRPEDEAARKSARSFRFGSSDSLLGYAFGEAGSPLVVLAHGWGGQGTQMLRMALALAVHGFEAVVLDFGNHGGSDPTAMGFDRYMDDSRALADHLKVMPYAWVAHSAAALAIMSARRTHDLEARAYVTIAAPFVPYVPLNRFRKMGADEATVDQVKPMLAREFRTDWDSLEQGLAWQPDPASDLLAIYDLDDPMVSQGDGERISAVWPGCRILKTSGFGHNRILGAEPVIRETVSFLSALTASSNVHPMPVE